MYITEETLRKILREELLEQSKRVDKKLKENYKQMERFVGVVTEDYQAKLTGAIENLVPLQVLPAMIRDLTEQISRMNDSHGAVRETVIDHEQRIRVLEK